MDEKAYLDFDLRIRRVDGKFSARVLDSPSGEARVEFSLPFSDLEMENFLLRVGRPRRGMRRLESPEMQATRVLGGQLFDAVFDDEVRSCFRRSLDEADRQNLGLRIRLRLDAPELADIPWEYLYDTALGRFLCLSTETPIVRYLDLPERIRPLPVKPPLRVLVMISSPIDYPPLDVACEWSKLKEAVSDLESQQLLELEPLEEASLSVLQQQLRRGEYHIFHFIGHGTFDERNQDGVLLLEDDTGRGCQVSGRDLGTILHDHRSLRLALLNACEGARTSRSDPFAGVAHSLVRQRIPAVIAMQFGITDEAAIALAHGFYAALVDDYPVDAALAEARKAIFAQEKNVEWGTPVLYLRAEDGRVFAVDRINEEERRKRQIAALFLQVQEATIERNWTAAMDRLQDILALDPSHAEAVAKVKEIQQEQQLSTLYDLGLKHYRAGRWREARKYLQQVQNISTSYKDVNTLLATAANQITQDRTEPMQRPIPPRIKRWLWVVIPVTLALLIGCLGAYNLFWPKPTATPEQTAEIPNIAGSPTPVPPIVPPSDTPTPSSIPTPSHTPTPAPTHTASPTPAPAYVSIPLPEEYLRHDAHTMAAERFDNPLRGRQVLGGIPFEFVGAGAFVQTQFEMDGERYSRVMPDTVSIPAAVDRVQRIYVLMNLAYGCAKWAPHGSQVGEIEFVFDDGTSETRTLQTGNNIREWSIGATWCDLISYVRDSSVQEVWRRYRTNNGPLSVIDMHVFEISSAHRGQRLTKIVIRDTSLHTSGYTNPAIIVFAITVMVQ